MSSPPPRKIMISIGEKPAPNHNSPNKSEPPQPPESSGKEVSIEDDPTIHTPLPPIPRTTNDHRHFSKEDHELLEAAFVKHKGRNPPRGAFNKLMKDLKRTGRGGIRSWFTVRRKKEADDAAQRKRDLKRQVASDAQVAAGLVAGSMSKVGVIGEEVEEDEDEPELEDVDEDENGNEEYLRKGDDLIDEREPEEWQ